MTETISAAAEIVTVILKMHFLQSPTDINYSNIQKLYDLKSYIYLSDIAAGNWRHLKLLAGVIQVQVSQKDQKNALGNWMAWLCS